MLSLLKKRRDVEIAPAGETVPLEQWLERFAASPEHRRIIERLSTRPAMTSAEETAMLYALIQHLRPALCLEIGTFFAQTARIMAEAAAESGAPIKVVTLDPFGGERVPGIIQTWPSDLQKVIEFRPWSSTQYFLELETLGTPKGADSQLGVVFVDGHHNFEYALFDIIRAADHLKPGGAIMVDDLEQEGPKTATLQFLRWNPAWKLFHKERTWTGASDARDMQDAVSQLPNGHSWGVLLAPDGIQIAGMTTKLTKRHLPKLPLKGLRLNLRGVSGPGTLKVNLLYCAVPYDFHITGKGIYGQRAEQYCKISEFTAELAIEFPSALTLTVPDDGMNIFYELELSYQSEDGQTGYIVLDAGVPVTLVTQEK